MNKHFKFSDPRLLLECDASGNPIAIRSNGGKRSSVVPQFDSMAEYQDAGGAADNPGLALVCNHLITSDGKHPKTIDGELYLGESLPQSVKPLLSYAQASATQGTFPVHDMETGFFTVAGLTSETLALVPLYDDTVDVGTDKIAVRKADGTLVQATALGNGSYALESMPYDYIQITKSAGSESVTISGEFRGEHNNTETVTATFVGITAAAVGRFPCDNFARATVIISGLSGGETINLAPVFAQDDTIASRGVLVKNSSDVISEALTLANGTYTIETIACRHIEIIKSAAVNSVTVTIEAV